MMECRDCVFHNLNCSGEEAVFILEVLIRIRPDIESYCALFDSVRIEAYRQLQEYSAHSLMGLKIEKKFPRRIFEKQSLNKDHSLRLRYAFTSRFLVDIE